MISLTHKILDTIEEKKISPKPEWRFTLHTVVLWFSIAFSIFFGALALSLFLFLSINGDWDILSRLPNRITFLIFSLPYAWLIATLAGLIFAEHQYRQTRGAYRHRYAYTILGVLIVTSVLGLLLYNLKLAHHVDSRLRNIPAYNHFINPRMAMWTRVENGRLAGEVVEIKNIRKFRLKDFSHKLWIVTLEDDSIVAGIVREGARVRLLGSQQDEDVFRANAVFPWFSHEMQRGTKRMKTHMEDVRLP